MSEPFALPAGPGALVPRGPAAIEPHYEQVPSSGRGKKGKRGLQALPGSPQEHLEDNDTHDSGSEAKNLEKIVNGNGGPRRGNGGNGGPRVRSGTHTTFYGPPANGNGDTDSKSKKSKKGRITRNVGGVGKGILKGIYQHRPGYGRRQEEELARPIAERIAQEQFGITEDTTQDTHYTLLEVSNTASTEDIRKAYRAKAKIYSPDVNPSQEAADIMVLLNKAKQDLLDQPQPAKRKAYDDSLRRSGSFDRMTKPMRKKAMETARKGIKYEQDVKNEAQALGIPLYKSGGRGVRKVRHLGDEDLQQFRRDAGIDPDLTDEQVRKDRKWGNTELPATERTKIPRSVQELSQEIEVHKANLQTAKNYRVAQEDEYKELRPGKVTKARRGLGAAISKSYQFTGALGGKIGDTTSRSNIGRTVTSSREDLGSLRSIQNPSVGKIRAAGAGGIKRSQGSINPRKDAVRLPVTGKPVRRRKKGF